ncbi:uncharacterized protein LOC130685618 [Daphnia carinata]|uniref:uncharacterized protein LOC130685618 n=1 Tax=Daphnia carinata TaxID=120202 RepID=UPI00257B4372|nr:uncharacterized protein LOC130685618 [Daphnia carinata]XP_059350645.1 uncharacterized protein LOC130685618 [Daphnia carinata]
MQLLATDEGGLLGVKMFLRKLYIPVFLEPFIALVKSAPGLHNSQQPPSGIVIAVANNDFVSNISNSSNTSQHWLNPRHVLSDLTLTLNAKQEFDTSSFPVTSQPSVQPMKAKLLNVSKTNTSTTLNFTSTVSRSFSDQRNLLIGFISRIFEDSLASPKIQNTSIIPSPGVSFPASDHYPDRDHRYSIISSLYHFSSPSRRLFWALRRYFSNL